MNSLATFEQVIGIVVSSTIVWREAIPVQDAFEKDRVQVCLQKIVDALQEMESEDDDDAFVASLRFLLSLRSAAVPARSALAHRAWCSGRSATVKNWLMNSEQSGILDWLEQVMNEHLQ